MIGSLICNAAIVVCGLIGTYLHFLKYGIGMFRYYTLCSNVFALLVCAVCLQYNASCLMGKRFFVPSWARVLKYFAACTLMVTMLIVIFVLAPMFGGMAALPYFLLQGEMLWHHLLCPVLAFVSFAWIDAGSFGNERRLPVIAVVPTLLYGITVTLLHLVGAMPAPYPFMEVTEQPIGESILWYIAIIALSYALAWLVWKANRRFGYSEDRLPEQPRPESEGFTADGYIKNQDCFSAYTYRTIPASNNGCGAVAVYDLRRYAGQKAEIADVLAELEKLHYLNIPGPTYMYAMRRYLKKYLSDYLETEGRESCLAAAAGSEMGLFRYLEQRIPHFVSYVRAENGQFRFFNVCDGQEDAVMSMEQFVHGHCVEGRVRLLCWKSATDKDTHH